MCQIENAFSILFMVGFEPEQDVPRIRHALLARALVNTPKTLYDGATLWTLHKKEYLFIVLPSGHYTTLTTVAHVFTRHLHASVIVSSFIEIEQSNLLV